ncbi:MAG TPA: DUF922 domain-containing protein [Bacteroidia bacterium]|nr:DUF922 domain-containing protein [Bacteroidia bacterium]QQR94269.1 MAG: DUF922 domain-containing protein [Bacteroidota bacterium]MBP7714559.1 DUF922 domain-containing protein [Bacteroidia bacterium]MBP8667914.1 DUF922 domain-containing protein [Bacteroidia bacterium]HOZ83180.1 DUF922 domain-containing protein [Bacteroidia bacterium]
MNRQAICLIALIAYATTTSAQELVDWQEKRLTWDDFEKRNLPHSRTGAITSSGIYFSYMENAAGLDIIVKAQMDKSRSWVNTHSMHDEVLSHEQMHFDISEIHARLLRQYFALNNKKTARHNPESIYKKYINRLRRMQDDYDRQTNHGNDMYMQMKWEEKIKTMLLDLEQYSGQEMAWR